jgi:hypothetical protein
MHGLNWHEDRVTFHDATGRSRSVPAVWTDLISEDPFNAMPAVVSHRMAKKQQMRRTDEGAHCLAQVRVAALNGELSPARLTAFAKTSRTGTRRSCHPP